MIFECAILPVASRARCGRPRPALPLRTKGPLAMDEPKRTVTITCPQCGRQRERVRAHWKWRTRAAQCRSCSMTRHAGKGSRLYRIWKNLRRRTGVVRGAPEEALARYVGRGIGLCPEWTASFEVFRDWAMANGYDDRLELDRRDNARGYAPENCRWVTHTQNMRNTRHNRLVTAFGRTQCLKAWSEETGIPYGCLQDRLRCGWESERAVSTPSGGKFHARRSPG